MKQPLSKKLRAYLPLVTLPLILLVCYGFWVNLSGLAYTRVGMQDGHWDLRAYDFNHDIVTLTGGAEFIPYALLTPEEFIAREDEVRIGFTDIGVNYPYATSRLRLIMPGDGHYTFTRISTHWNDRIFVNGMWLYDIGTPAASRENEVARTARITFTARPVYADGYYVIEILHQNSNAFHRIGGHPHLWIVGGYGIANAVLRIDYTTNVMLGLYLALSIIFLIVFLMLGGKHNLYFALFCFMWVLRVGVTDSKVFTALVPWLSGEMLLRLEYTAVPVAAALVLAVINELFPGF